MAKFDTSKFSNILMICIGLLTIACLFVIFGVKKILPTTTYITVVYSIGFSVFLIILLVWLYNISISKKEKKKRTGKSDERMKFLSDERMKFLKVIGKLVSGKQKGIKKESDEKMKLLELKQKLSDLKQEWREEVIDKLTSGKQKEIISLFVKENNRGLTKNQIREMLNGGGYTEKEVVELEGQEILIATNKHTKKGMKRFFKINDSYWKIHQEIEKLEKQLGK